MIDATMTPAERRAYLTGYLTANRRAQEILVHCNNLSEALRHLVNLQKQADKEMTAIGAGGA